MVSGSFFNTYHKLCFRIPLILVKTMLNFNIDQRRFRSYVFLDLLACTTLSAVSTLLHATEKAL
jgi:hypothetical protein